MTLNPFWKKWLETHFKKKWLKTHSENNDSKPTPYTNLTNLKQALYAIGLPHPPVSLYVYTPLFMSSTADFAGSEYDGKQQLKNALDPLH